MRLLASLLIIFIVATLAAGCGSDGPFADKPLKVATTTGPHAELLYAAREVAAKNGLVIEILEYDDNVKPNDLLVQGEVDANCFQPLPYFEDIVADRRLPLVAVAKTVIFPVALYSKKITQITDLPAGATVAIPNDPVSGGRALHLLEMAGVVSLRPGAGLKAAVNDITANPLNVRIVEVDAAAIPRQLDNYALAAINSAYALAYGLVPARDALASEGAESLHPHIIAVRVQNQDNPAVRKLIEAYQSDHVAQYISRRFQGTIVPAW